MAAGLCCTAITTEIISQARAQAQSPQERALHNCTDPDPRWPLTPQFKAGCAPLIASLPMVSVKIHVTDSVQYTLVDREGKFASHTEEECTFIASGQGRGSFDLTYKTLKLRNVSYQAHCIEQIDWGKRTESCTSDGAAVTSDFALLAVIAPYQRPETDRVGIEIPMKLSSGSCASFRSPLGVTRIGADEMTVKTSFPCAVSNCMPPNQGTLAAHFHGSPRYAASGGQDIVKQNLPGSTASFSVVADIDVSARWGKGPKCGQKDDVPEAEGALQQLLACMGDCFTFECTVSSTREAVPVHKPGTPHRRGEAADILVPPGSEPEALRCAAKCGAGYGQDERKHPSKLSTGPHVHVQIGHGLRGGRGDLP